LVRKGQSGDKTLEAFRLLRQNGILPVPMMMHCDEQPLVSWKSHYGLLNQLKILRKAGALYTQVLMLTPSPGSKWYEETYTSGLAFETVGGKKVEPYIVDGNYVIASKHPLPWIKQLNLLAAYTYFFNPLRLLFALVRPKSKIPFADAETRPAAEIQRYSRRRKLRRWVHRKLRAHLTDAGVQLLGISGLFPTYRRTLGWSWSLFRGKIHRCNKFPTSRIPMRGTDGSSARHAIPGTPVSDGPIGHISLEESKESQPNAA